ncbi:MAG: hypothetical protein Q9227_000349 [Pyrenula ochraceoflavens]
MRYSIVSALFTLAAVATAQAPVADTSKPPNAALSVTTPDKDQQLPIGSDFVIKYSGQTQGTISLVLLDGCPKNCVPKSTIVGGSQNTGSFTWHISESLSPSTTNYGIMLVSDADKSYQYSNQFNLVGGSNSNTSPSGTPSGTGSAGGNNGNNSTTTATVIYASSSATGTGNVSVPVLTPTAPMTVPSTLMSTATGVPSTSVASGTVAAPSASETSNAAAAKVRGLGGLVVAGLVGVLAF